MTAASLHKGGLDTARLILRVPNASDVDAMVAFFGSDHARFYSGPMSVGDAWRKFAGYVGQWTLSGYGMFSIEHRDTGATIGMAGPFHPADFPEPEMSWLLTEPKYEGQGFASEACTAILTHLFDDLGWSQVVSYIDPDNHASRALALRLGAVEDPAAVVPLPGCVAYRHRPGGMHAS